MKKKIKMIGLLSLALLLTGCTDSNIMNVTDVDGDGNINMVYEYKENELKFDLKRYEGKEFKDKYGDNKSTCSYTLYEDAIILTYDLYSYEGNHFGSNTIRLNKEQRFIYEDGDRVQYNTHLDTGENFELEIRDDNSVCLTTTSLSGEYISVSIYTESINTDDDWNTINEEDINKFKGTYISDDDSFILGDHTPVIYDIYFGSLYGWNIKDTDGEKYLDGFYPSEITRGDDFIEIKGNMYLSGGNGIIHIDSNGEAWVDLANVGTKNGTYNFKKYFKKEK